MKKELRKKISKRQKGNNNSCYKHGMHGTRFQRIFVGINRRCDDKNNKDYENYGGRGIECEWKTLKEFRNDMRDSYVNHCDEHGKKNTQIDRINNDGNYCKKNCRWATAKKQGRNRRTNKLITFRGKTQCISAWGEELGLCRKVIAYRLRNNWTIKNALTIKPNHANRRNKII